METVEHLSNRSGKFSESYGSDASRFAESKWNYRSWRSHWSQALCMQTRFTLGLNPQLNQRAGQITKDLLRSFRIKFRSNSSNQSHRTSSPWLGPSAYCSRCRC
jgi:hypothetical protein